MAGYNLNYGQYDDRSVSDDELWSALSVVFSAKSRNDASYKFGFLKAIIDNLFNVDKDLKLTFDQLFGKFTEIYWNLVLKYHLRQKAPTSDGKESYIESILHEAAVRYKIDSEEPIPYESLTPAMMHDISHRVKMKCKTNVVGALFEDTNRLFYSFSKKEEWLQINPAMYEFICKHKVIIEKVNYYEWARFMEKVNEDSVLIKLLDKLDKSSKRNNLSYYRQILYNEFESRKCFYCGRPLNPDKVDVDHFIPWSFVKDDNIWNLVLACPSCNRKKSDKLPTEYFLNELEERNQHFIVEDHRFDKINYRNSKLVYVYDWAKANGYEKLWTPVA